MSLYISDIAALQERHMHCSFALHFLLHSSSRSRSETSPPSLALLLDFEELLSGICSNFIRAAGWLLARPKEGTKGGCKSKRDENREKREKVVGPTKSEKRNFLVVFLLFVSSVVCVAVCTTLRVCVLREGGERGPGCGSRARLCGRKRKRRRA